MHQRRRSIPLMATDTQEAVLTYGQPIMSSYDRSYHNFMADLFSEFIAQNIVQNIDNAYIREYNPVFDS